MKLLVITPFNPFPPFWGGGTRTYNLLKHLAQENEVDLIFPTYRQFQQLSGTKYRAQLQELGMKLHGVGPSSSWLQYINPLLALKAVSIARERDVDLVICDYPWSGLYSLVLKKLINIPFVLMEHNVEYLVTKQTNYEDPALTRLVEKAVAKEAESIFCVSSKDKKRLNGVLNINKDKIDVVRNGYDADRFQPDQRSGRELKRNLGLDNKPLVLFYGKMDYLPNREAVKIIRESIAPQVLAERPETRFLIVGGGYEFDRDQELDGAIRYMGAVENIEDYVNAADVVVIPIKKGGGTRIKIIESVACNKDIVSTRKGIEDLLDKHTSKFVEIADEEEAFASKVIDLLDRPDPQVSQSFENKYAWKNIFAGIKNKLKQSLD